MGWSRTTEAIVSRLYEGILNPSEWQGALQTVQAELQCASFHHVDIDRAERRVRSVAVSLGQGEAPASEVTAYEQVYAPLDIRLRGGWNVCEGGVWWDQEHFDAQTMACAPIYAEFLAPLGLRYTMSVSLRDGSTSRDFLAFMRHQDQQPYSAEEQALVQHLMPHLVRANMLRHRSERLAEIAAWGGAALDALPQALAVVDAALRPRHLNAAAEQALAGPCALALRHGALQAADPDVHSQLAQRVVDACGRGGAVRAGLVRLVGPQGALPDSAPPIIHVLPLQASHPLAQFLSGIPYALLVWAVPPGHRRAEQIGVALGLTDAEVRLALMLAQGQTVKDFALLQGCTWHTARTHAKNLLRKTGCQRQLDVVRLLQSLMWA